MRSENQIEGEEKMRIERASDADFEHIREMLGAANLPTSDLSRSNMAHFLVARVADRIVGSVGLEIHERDALLRSLIVLPEHRSLGLGVALSNAAEALATSRGIATLTLLTTTAAPFFERAGYAVIPRSEVPESLQASAEFSTLCPSSATCMRKTLA